MLRSLTLRCGTREDPQPVKIDIAGIVCVVGPNNSGKSFLLKQLEHSLRVMGEYKPEFIVDFDIVSNLQYYNEVIDPNTETVMAARLADARSHTENVHTLHALELPEFGKNMAVNINKASLLETLKQYHGGANSYYELGLSGFFTFLTSRLDGRSRFQLMSPSQSSDYRSNPKTILQVLFKCPGEMNSVRRYVSDAFGLYPVIDAQGMETLQWRFSRRELPSWFSESKIGVKSISFLDKCLASHEVSDGVLAYTGLVAALHAGGFLLTLVDEPEAFLHPPLARKLGRDLAKILEAKKGTLIAATHSPDFVFGCIDSGYPTTILRMDYRDGKCSPKVVDPNVLKKFLAHPLFRSIGVASSLFYDGVVITEADNDRAVYSEIYRKIALQGDRTPEVLFLNAQNKNTLHEIFGPLREFGIPAAAIADIDALKDELTRMFEPARIPKAMRPGLNHLKTHLIDTLKKANLDLKKPNVVSQLTLEDQENAEKLFQDLNKYGIFVVPVGELECWLKDMEISGDKTRWAKEVLQRLGDDANDPGYIAIGDGDIWKFVKSITAWIADPNRKGM